MSLIEYKNMIVIAVVTDIALRERSRLTNARELENRHHLPARHLEPALQALARGGILDSTRGPGGGYKLAREPARITVEDILRAMGALEARQDVGHSPLLNTVVVPAIAKAESTFLDQLSWISIKDLVRMATGKKEP
jgi:Rrf2 family protein